MEQFVLISKLINKRNNTGRSVLFCFVLLVFLTTFSHAVFAQEKYPTKPITYIVGYPPGGASEVSSRAIANAASKILGQPVVIVTKPGGGSAVAMAGMKNEKPDGYTISLLPTGAIIAHHLRKLSYDSAKDFTPIMQYAIFQEGLVVRSDSPWKTFKEFLDYAKANPGKIRYGSAGAGSPPHLVMEQLRIKTDVKWTHIPFDGTAPDIAAILGGHVEASADNTFWKPHVLSGRLRLLAGFDEKRINFMPDIPTVKEWGYDVFHPSVICIVGPKDLPPHMVDILHGAFKKALEDPEFIKVMDQMDMLITYRNPQDLAKHLVKTNDAIESLVQHLGLRIE